MSTKIGAPLIHGGDIYSASREFGRAPEDWLDLSTGINPRSYPFDVLTDKAAARLPYLHPGFLQAAKQYYASEHFVPVAGTQSSIAVLPDILLSLSSVQRVLVPELGYSEHAHQWRMRGVELVYYPSDNAELMQAGIERALDAHPDTHLVVINPNNPTAITVSVDLLTQWREKQSRDARLIVDEAFIDVTPEHSILSDFDANTGVIVLRSFGKFFGMAGLRLGFVFAEREVLDALGKAVGVWAINGPAQAIAQAALTDFAWQQNAREWIVNDGACTRALFRPLLGSPCVEHALFSVYTKAPRDARACYEQLAGAGILSRVVPWRDDKALLRLGLLRADDESARARVGAAVRAF